jgi:hypothetical protein
MPQVQAGDAVVHVDESDERGAIVESQEVRMRKFGGLVEDGEPG